MELQLSTRAGRGCVVVELAGELDMATEPALRGLLEEILTDGDQHVVMDLGKVDFVDSTGLGLVVATYKRLLAGGGRLSLAAPKRPVVGLLRLTSLDRIIAIYGTVEEAEASLPG